MNKVEIRSREEWKDIFKIDQLHCVMNSDFDIHVNGSFSVENKEELTQYKNAQVYGNICNSEGEVLHVCGDGYKNHPILPGAYYSFNLYCREVTRFFDMEELAYVEVYLTVNEENKY